MQKMTNQELAQKIAGVTRCVLDARKTFETAQPAQGICLRGLENRLAEVTQALERGTLVSPATLDVLTDFSAQIIAHEPVTVPCASEAPMSWALELHLTIDALAEGLRDRNRYFAVASALIPGPH
jgi:hypothetical protein